MKQYIFSILFLFFINSAQSQDDKFINFLGTLELPGKIIIPLKLSFKQLPNGEIEGHTITDIYGKDNTKTRITGTFDSKKNLLSFKETENISTKSKSDKAEFCFIEVNQLKIRSIRGKAIIQGTFAGKFPNGKVCTNGNIYLIGEDAIDDAAKKFLASKHQSKQDSLDKLKNLYADLKTKTNLNVLEKEEQLSINWKNNDLILEVWDGSADDQDEVTIFVNNVEVLEKFIISYQKKKLVLPFSGDTCVVRILATNEGKSPPNTASITVRDGDKNTTLITKLKKGESAFIKLTK
ncbi:MAG: hypothetical protein LW692_09060 [Sphingobacteriales bacterium]|nr:hypothetical protein [Sphingobacteriales bacterium]